MKPTPIQRILIVLAILLALVLAMATLAQAEPIRVVDDKGRTVTLPQPPQRIVSLLPSLTETVCALGACERLVGVDRYSNWPAQVAQLPVVGGGLDPNIEAIVALRPDVVLMATSSRAQARLNRWVCQWWRWSPKPTPTCSACSAKWARCWACRMRSGSGV